MLCFEVKKVIEKRLYVPNFSFERIPKLGVLNRLRLKQTVRKMGEFEKLKFVKSGLDYKRLLRQTKRSGKKSNKISNQINYRIIAEFEKSGVRKIGIQLYY